MKTTDDRAEAIFSAALELPAGPQRETLILAECRDDPALATRVRGLIEAQEDATRLHESGPLSPAVEAALARLTPEQPGQRIGPYKLREQIGEGGFGTVWVADQETPMKRRVALKVIKLGMDTKEVIARFEQERQALAMMDHPNIARVLDAGATEFGRPYFVMELVRGVKITDYCDEHHLPTAERLDLFVQVCLAVQHAHQKGIIHRDIKPSNILVTLQDGAPVPKVIDFGVAKATQQRLTDKTIYTQIEQMIGTPLYMSPEQAQMSGLDVDTRSDIYSLGVLLYELLVGRTPFDPATLRNAGRDELRRVIREKEPPKPSTLLQTMTAAMRTTVAQHRHADAAKIAGQLRGDLDWIVMKALEKDRARRYQTANALAMDIRRFQADEPVTAAAPSASYRFGKFARRNKTILGVAAVIAAVLVVATVVSISWAIKADQARSKEEAARTEAEAISKFLTEVFQSPDPVLRGRTITVAAALDGAARKLDTDLAGQPERRVKLQETIGWTYHALGLDEEAIPLLENARNYHVEKNGPEDPKTISAMSNLAVAYHGFGRRPDALKMREDVLTLSRKVNGPEHRDTLMAMHHLASSYRDASRHLEALTIREQVLTLIRKANGPEHPDTLRAMNNLAQSYACTERQEEAFTVRLEILTVSRKVNGKEHPSTLTIMHNLAESYLAADRREKALEFAENALALRNEVLGPNHADTLATKGLVANCYYAAGRRDEAFELRKEVLDLRRKRDPEDGDTLVAMGYLADSHSAAGRYADALKLWLEAYEGSLKLYRLAPDHDNMLWAKKQLAKAYGEAGRLDDAIKLGMDALALHDKVFGAAHAETIETLDALATAHERKGDLEKAIELRSLQAVDQAWLGKEAEHAATCQRLLEAAAGTKDPAMAAQAVRAFCIRPSSDRKLLDQALAVAHRAIEMGQGHADLPRFYLAVGMAEYRSGNYPAAEAAFGAVEVPGLQSPPLQGITQAFQALTLFREGKAEAARPKLASAETLLKPLSARDVNPFKKAGGSHDDLMLWLACKEAKALFQPGKLRPASVKPGGI